ncbi:MAG: Crp/Fnr family transcriptional regulator [Oscillospiraceae bacterium]|nr:Crp/Fnr family transcriptional regulator [Oscillospiraceae bacterium]
MTDLPERTYRKNEIIYRQNEYEMCMYDILYGGVTLYLNYGAKEQILVKELCPGAYFGEMELVEARPRTTTAVATEETRVKVYTAEAFGSCFQEKPALVMAIMQQMSARIRELTREYNDACRVVAEAMDAEKRGEAKSDTLQKERKRLSDYFTTRVRYPGTK